MAHSVERSDDGLPAPSDGSLLRRYRDGSEDAATQLYLRYAQRLRGLAQAQLSPALARQVDVDDLVQSVFGSFFGRARCGYYDAPVGDELWGLFLVSALNKIRNRAAFHHAARRDARRTTLDGNADHYPDPAADDAHTLLRLAVDEALGRLPPAQRVMVQLRIEGYEVAEIAQHTGRSRRTVERLLQEARARLARLLHEGLPT